MPQTLTSLLLAHGMTTPLLSDSQVARVVDGSAQRRHNLVNRAVQAGELHRVRRGLYLLSKPYRAYDCHPYAMAQRLIPGSYISLETALAYHGWIPEAVYVTASIVPGTKSQATEDSAMGKFSFHPLATQPGHFLELVSQITFDKQTVLVARPLRALLDLVCLRKEEWQGLAWFETSMRIERDHMRSVTAEQLQTLQLVYKQKRMQLFLSELAKALGLELAHD
jgi:predicted transcriptional regulator of viral defense system